MGENDAGCNGENDIRVQLTPHRERGEGRVQVRERGEAGNNLGRGEGNAGSD